MQVNFPPPLFDFDGNWANYQNMIESQYLVFVRDFITNTTSFVNKSIVIRLEPKEFNKEDIFWHIVTRDITGGGREAELARARRLHWLRPMVQNYTHGALRYFDYIEGTNLTRHYFWMRADSYLLILEERKTRIFITSAYIVDKKYMMETLEKRYNDYLARVQDSN